MRKFLVAICMASAMAMSAQLVVDQGQPENQFEVGLRLGFNSSNVSNNYTEAVADMKQANNNWQEGLTVGAVVDMNIYNCLAVQTGVIYQRRRSDYQNLRINEENGYFAYYFLALWHMDLAYIFISWHKKIWAPQKQVRIIP